MISIVLTEYAGVAEWQTQLTQNQPGFPRGGSSPFSGTKGKIQYLQGFGLMGYWIFFTQLGWSVLAAADSRLGRGYLIIFLWGATDSCFFAALPGKLRLQFAAIYGRQSKGIDIKWNKMENISRRLQ